MPAQLATMTAARAIIKRNGVAIGYMRNLRATESKQRGSVMGIGQVTKQERPVMAITCTWSCDFYLIDLKTSGVPGLDNREVQDVEIYKDTLTLLSTPVDICIFKKEAKVVVDGVVVGVQEDVLATLKDVYLDSSSWDVSEGQISMLNQSGEYTQPVILSI